MKIIWTKHAEARQKEWKIKLGITKEDVEAVLLDPDQVVPGEGEAMVAQKKWAEGLIRVPFIQVEGARKILTVYYTSKIDRYWKG